MTREEAIKEIKSWDFLEGKEVEAIKTLIPELKESEDERMKRIIMKFVWGYTTTPHSIINGDKSTLEYAKEVEAYLEKQKEFELTEEDKKIIPEALVMLCDDIINHRVHTPIKTDEEGARKIKAFLKTFNRQPYKTKEEWEKQKEQKPVEWNEDSVKFEEGFKAGRESGLRDGQKYVLNNLDSYGLCKPAEWSDTDNIGWDEAFACVTRAEKSAKNEEELQNAVTAEKWLKEIKFKYCVHPVKQEWSEEDEKQIAQIERIVKNAGCMKMLQEKIHNWFKSLRPSWKPSAQELGALKTAVSVLTEERTFPKTAEQIQKIIDVFDGKELRKDWKPSEEQMDALHYVKQFDYGGHKAALVSLYEQLKKLM